MTLLLTMASIARHGTPADWFQKSGRLGVADDETDDEMTTDTQTQTQTHTRIHVFMHTCRDRKSEQSERPNTRPTHAHIPLSGSMWGCPTLMGMRNRELSSFAMTSASSSSEMDGGEGMSSAWHTFKNTFSPLSRSVFTQNPFCVWVRLARPGRDCMKE